MGLYEVLGVDPCCSQAEIQKAYRSLSQINHPDKGGDVDAFQAISNAYQILSDEERRAIYDATGEEKDLAITDSEVISSLGNLMLSIVDSIDIDRVDLVKEMKAHLFARSTGASQNIRQIQAVIAQREKVKVRLSRTEGQNHLAGALEADILNKKRMVLQLEREKKVLTKMEEQLIDYLYQVNAVGVVGTGHTITYMIG